MEVVGRLLLAEAVGCKYEKQVRKTTPKNSLSRIHFEFLKWSHAGQVRSEGVVNKSELNGSGPQKRKKLRAKWRKKSYMDR